MQLASLCLTVSFEAYRSKTPVFFMQDAIVQSPPRTSSIIVEVLFPSLDQEPLLNLQLGDLNELDWAAMDVSLSGKPAVSNVVLKFKLLLIGWINGLHERLPHSHAMGLLGHTVPIHHDCGGLICSLWAFAILNKDDTINETKRYTPPQDSHSEIIRYFNEAYLRGLRCRV